MGSILHTVKKLVGLSELDDSFDLDLLIHINAAFNVLVQMGVGPADGFSITDSESTWGDLPLSPNTLDMVKSYVCLYTRKAFDPPENGSAMQALNDTLSELTFRLYVEVNYYE